MRTRSTSSTRQQGGHLLELVTDRPQTAADLLKETLESWRVSLFGDRLHVIVDEDADAGVRNITERLGGAGIHVLKAHEESYSLEDVFIAIVEKAKGRKP